MPRQVHRVPASPCSCACPLVVRKTPFSQRKRGVIDDAFAWDEQILLACSHVPMPQTSEPCSSTMPCLAAEVRKRMEQCCLPQPERPNRQVMVPGCSSPEIFRSNYLTVSNHKIVRLKCWHVPLGSYAGAPGFSRSVHSSTFCHAQ